MSLDLEKLTPAPWRSERRYSNGCETVPHIHCEPSKDREYGWIADLVGAPYLGYESTLVNAEFIALARNAFDVMVRRGWGVVQNPTGWYPALPIMTELYSLRSMRWTDPFTALVEADAWYRKNVENPK